MSQPTPRDIAARVVHRVLHEGAYSHILIHAELEAASLPPRDRALATELAYGTLTWHLLLQRVALTFIPRPERLQPEVLAVIEVALYQLGYLDRVPPHAAINEAVESTRRLGKRFKPAVGFVNGVLRAAVRQRAAWPQAPPLHTDPLEHVAHRGALPPWIAALLLQDRPPEDAAAFAAALTERPRLTLRLPHDAPPLPPADAPTPGRWAPHAWDVPRLTPAVRDAIDHGHATVQDEGAQLVSLLANPRPGARILDACAGLGGKTAHLAQLAGPDAHITAVDPNASKLDLLRQTFQRLRLPLPRTLQTTIQDATPDALGPPFDLILIDAPCSGLGILRRHPETRWHRSPDDLDALANIQRDLLQRALPLLAPGGRLVYSVCTFTPQEGPHHIQHLLHTQPHLRLAAAGHPEVPWGDLQPTPLGFSLLPHTHGTDGFFLAALDALP